MNKRKATKVYCWNYDGRNDCAVLAASWKEAVAGTRASVAYARQHGSSFVVGDSWITEWPYERGKPMYRPISENKIPWRATPYLLRYEKSNAFSPGTWI